MPGPALADKDAARAADGYRVYKKILEQGRIYADPELAAYVDAVGQRVARASGRPGLDYTFTLLDDPGVNAFALPGGYVVVNRGLLAYLQSEDQLAAVLGHEVAHVTARHAEKQKRRAEMTQITSSTLGTLAGLYTGSGELAQLTNYLGAAWFSGYGREMELEADRLGVVTMVRAGYNPRAMLDVIMLLKNQDLAAQRRRRDGGGRNARYHGVFDSHPSNDRRLHETLEQGALEAGSERRIEPVADYLSMVQGLSYGPPKSSGFDAHNTYFDESLKIAVDFPDDWRTAVKGARISAHPADDRAAASLVVRVMSPSPGVSLESRFAQSLGKNSFAFGQPFSTASGLKGYRADVVTRPKSGQFWHRQAALVDMGDATFLILGEIKDVTRITEWLRAFEGALASLRPLRNGEKASVADARIRLHTTVSGESYESLAGGNRLLADELRLLNADYPGGKFGPGERIKLIVRD